MDDSDLIRDLAADRLKDVQIAKVARVLRVDGSESEAEGLAFHDVDVAAFGPGSVGVVGPVGGIDGRGGRTFCAGEVLFVSEGIW